MCCVARRYAVAGGGAVVRLGEAQAVACGRGVLASSWTGFSVVPMTQRAIASRWHGNSHGYRVTGWLRPGIRRG